MAQQPLYQQIADDLREQIESGALPPGSQLPTEDELRRRYSASRNTVRDAITRLKGQGLIQTRAGQGTFVPDKIDPYVTVLTAGPQSARLGETVAQLSNVSATERVTSRAPRVEVVTPPVEITARLRVPPGTQLLSRHQERLIDNNPWSLQTSFYPMEFVQRGAARLFSAEDISEGAVAYLKATLGLRQIGYRDWITARNPNSYEETFFRMPHDGTVFELFRTAFDQDKTPMRVTVTVLPAHQNQFIVNVGDDLPDPEYDDAPPSTPNHAGSSDPKQ
jgi:GntR family transcriptional regulator